MSEGKYILNHILQIFIKNSAKYLLKNALTADSLLLKGRLLKRQKH
ncbi:hypothetical protein ECH_1032 [Ehrlichia chaffeensis str. Arkansas]|uniref:Uncharacterized protein n=1 Tax=Ehrlichia chaffeensis (strain ATCC CRL-10679 / Arkansas) TaxID=205920 RepID=Q2GFG5_EHRCR|nr:hypothetical protein ECH_1032 [Ehrlichia chaffeensis str. Arkansas]